MNPLISMGFNPPNPVAAYTGGVEAKGIVDDRQNQNALRGYIQQNGAGIMSGDQNALAGLGGMGPQGLEMAMGVQNQQLSQEATRQGMAIDQERLGMARQQIAAATRQAALEMKDDERARITAQVERSGKQLAAAIASGNPDAIRAVMPNLPAEARQALEAGENPQSVLFAMDVAGETLMSLAPPAPTTGMQTLMARAAAAGLVPGTPEYQDFMAEGDKPSTNISLNTASEVGTIPPGMELITDPETGARSMRPIPGGPAAIEAAQADEKASLTAAKNDVSTQIVTTAAKEARDRIRGGITGTTGLPGQVMGNIDQTDAGILRSQIETLTAVAKIGNLQAMRAASPTGGALGAVSDKENQMLAAASGALNPNAPADVFAKQLDNYELTLLQVIHGPEAGAAIFESTRDPADRPSQKSRVIEMDGYKIEAID